MLKKIDDIFENTVGLVPFFKAYHYGWRSDMNGNLINTENHSEEPKFPRVFVSASPNGKIDLNFKNARSKYTVIFEELQNYDSDNRTLIEYWDELFVNGLSYLQFLRKNLQEEKFDLIIEQIPFNSDSNVSNMRLVCVWFNIEIVGKIPC